MMDRAQAAYRHLLARGYSPTMAAGIVGNLVQESGVQSNGPRGDNGTAFGVAQWRGPRQVALRNFAAERGASYTDLPTQLDFLDHELRTQYGRGYQALQQAKTPQEAAGMFALHYERPKGAETGNWMNIHGIQNRTSWANKLAGVEGSPMLMPHGAAMAGQTPPSRVSPTAFSSGQSMQMPDGAGQPQMAPRTVEQAWGAGIGDMLAGLANSFSPSSNNQKAPEQPKAQTLGADQPDFASLLAQLAQQPKRENPIAGVDWGGSVNGMGQRQPNTDGMAQTLPYKPPQIGMDEYEALTKKLPWKPDPGIDLSTLMMKL